MKLLKRYYVTTGGTPLIEITSWVPSSELGFDINTDALEGIGEWEPHYLVAIENPIATVTTPGGKPYFSRQQRDDVQTIFGEPLGESERPPEGWLLIKAQYMEPIDAEKARRQAVKAIRMYADTMREKIAKPNHYLQPARWGIQLAAAQAVLDGSANKGQLDMMALEARLRNRGESPDQLAARVIANSNAFMLAGAAIDGIEVAALDKVKVNKSNDYASILAEAKAVAIAEFDAIFGGSQK